MKSRSIIFGGIAIAALGMPAMAHAYWGQTTTAVNMRTCGSTQCPVILTLSQGSAVWVGGSAGGWYRVSYGGYDGYVSGRYVATQYAAVPTRPQVTLGFTVGNAPPRPLFGFYRQPVWDPRFNAWYDGRRWFFDGRWHSAPPSGVSFGFTFGG